MLFGRLPEGGLCSSNQAFDKQYRFLDDLIGSLEVSDEKGYCWKLLTRHLEFRIACFYLQIYGRRKSFLPAVRSFERRLPQSEAFPFPFERLTSLSPP